jgi:hypothetical protein
MRLCQFNQDELQPLFDMINIFLFVFFCYGFCWSHYIRNNIKPVWSYSNFTTSSLFADFCCAWDDDDIVGEYKFTIFFITLITHDNHTPDRRDQVHTRILFEMQIFSHSSILCNFIFNWTIINCSAVWSFQYLESISKILFNYFFLYNL